MSTEFPPPRLRARGRLCLAFGLAFAAWALAQDRPSFAESHQVYEVPALTLVDQQGRAQALNQLMRPGQALALQFFFTSCPAICPALSGSMAELARDPQIRCVSISIDPDHDTPAQLLRYADELGAGPNWWFLTGDEPAVRAAQQAFGAFAQGKQQHRPLTFLRPAGSATWLRLEGFPSAAALRVRLHSEAAP